MNTVIYTGHIVQSGKYKLDLKGLRKFLGQEICIYISMKFKKRIFCSSLYQAEMRNFKAPSSVWMVVIFEFGVNMVSVLTI